MPRLLCLILISATQASFASDIDKAFDSAKSVRSRGDFAVESEVTNSIGSHLDGVVGRAVARERELHQSVEKSSNNESSGGTGNKGSGKSIRNKIDSTSTPTRSPPTLSRVNVVETGAYETTYEATCSNGNRWYLIRRKDGSWYYSHLGRNLVTGQGDSANSIGAYVCSTH